MSSSRPGPSECTCRLISLATSGLLQCLSSVHSSSSASAETKQFANYTQNLLTNNWIDQDQLWGGIGAYKGVPIRQKEWNAMYEHSGNWAESWERELGEQPVVGTKEWESFKEGLQVFATLYNASCAAKGDVDGICTNLEEFVKVGESDADEEERERRAWMRNFFEMGSAIKVYREGVESEKGKIDGGGESDSESGAGNEVGFNSWSTNWQALKTATDAVMKERANVGALRPIESRRKLHF